MKLTPVRLYTVNYHGDGALDASESVWAATPESAARMFAFAYPWNDARFVTVMHPDGDQTYRIDPDTDPAPPPAPAQGWVKGAPPLIDGAWFIAADHHGNVHAIQCNKPASLAPWNAANRYSYMSSEFTHHLPTPIQLPKES